MGRHIDIKRGDCGNIGKEYVCRRRGKYIHVQRERGLTNENNITTQNKREGERDSAYLHYVSDV